MKAYAKIYHWYYVMDRWTSSSNPTPTEYHFISHSFKRSMSRLYNDVYTVDVTLKIPKICPIEGMHKKLADMLSNESTHEPISFDTDCA